VKSPPIIDHCTSSETHWFDQVVSESHQLHQNREKAHFTIGITDNVEN
jgi:hypothetical protein